MYEKDAQFDAFWSPERYPTADALTAAATWRYVVEPALGRVGVIWLSDNSVGVKWVTQSDSINSLIKSFDMSRGANLGMSDAYLIAVADHANELDEEVYGEYSDVDSAMRELMASKDQAAQ